MNKKATQKEYDSFKRMAEALKEPAPTIKQEGEGFTKGEWELRGNKVFVKGTNNSICLVHIQKAWNGRIEPIQDHEAEANAALIASSPLLLKENKELKKAIQGFIDNVITDKKLYDNQIGYYKGVFRKLLENK